jgi:hypothetical protein
VTRLLSVRSERMPPIAVSQVEADSGLVNWTLAPLVRETMPLTTVHRRCATSLRWCVESTDRMHDHMAQPLSERLTTLYPDTAASVHAEPVRRGDTPVKHQTVAVDAHAFPAVVALERPRVGHEDGLRTRLDPSASG